MAGRDEAQREEERRATGPVRRVGVEEELLLVDEKSGTARSVASRVLRVAQRRGDTEETRSADPHEDLDGEPGGSLGPELQEQQVETDTPPEEDLHQLETELRRWREKARASAAETGALVLASGTSLLPVQPQRMDDARYDEIAERFGITAAEQLSCGCHVHVSVDSDDEAIGTLDRIRVWLPALLALSANSPYWQGEDTGYESYRPQVLTRWPTFGPTPLFGDAEQYDAHLRAMVDTEVPLDEGMAYFDARPSRKYPTLEIRAADVCLDVADAVLVAALCRALVDTGAREWAIDVPPVAASTSLLRLASWRAAKDGTAGELLDPRTHRPVPAREVADSLVEHVTPSLERNGDLPLVTRGVERIFAGGTGASAQRRAVEEAGSLERAVVRLAHLTSP